MDSRAPCRKCAETEIEAIVRRFERFEFRPEDFHHSDHLVVMTFYLQQMPLRQALARMREMLLEFCAFHQRKGYNETITRFWLLKVAQVLAVSPDDVPLPELVQRVRQRLPDKELVFAHYSRERALSEEAKRSWVEPDVKGL